MPNKLEQEQGEKFEEWVKRTAKQHAKRPLSPGSRLLPEPGQSQVAEAFNQALKEERRRKVN